MPFGGIKLRLLEDSLLDNAFQPIPAGESVSVNFDLAELYDLSTVGRFNITTDGALSYAEAGSNEITGSAPYLSNTLQANIDNHLAASVRVGFLARRVHHCSRSGRVLQVPHISRWK